MRRIVASTVTCAALLAGSVALACGAPFGNGVEVDPHQDIIVSWKDGIETYVFQPTFCGTAADFGLILPVPSMLAQKPDLSAQQAFTTAAALSEPRREEVTSHGGGPGCVGASDMKAAGGAADNSPRVVASGQVGFLDWTQLQAKDESMLTDWLNANGYPFSATARSAFGYYLSKGWYFLAFRISREAVPGGGTICKALGPIAFSFPSAKPVIPSRMATAGAREGTYTTFSWRIFGITRGDSQLGFAQRSSSGDRTLWYSGAVTAADAPLLGGLADAGDRLTRLTLSFYSSSTDTDVELALAPPQDYRGVEYVSVEDNSMCSVNGGRRSHHSFWLAFAGLGLAGLCVWRQRRRGR